MIELIRLNLAADSWDQIAGYYNFYNFSFLLIHQFIFLT